MGAWGVQNFENDDALDSLPEALIVWLQQPQGLFRKQPGFTEDPYALAHKVRNKITADSEQKELWEETDDYPE